jgi:alkaline phosphatase D
MLDLSTLSEAIRREGGINRRLFLAYSAALTAVPWLGERAVGQPARRGGFAADPFSTGITSGDPTDTGVVLWTRLAPKPLEVGGGMTPEAMDVRWDVANDEGMKDIVRSGTAVATPQLGHSLHVEVEGLKPDRWYWYRFRAGDADSPVGRTRTLPDPSTRPAQLRFVFASCQHYETGLFTAYEHMAKDDLDLVVHLGDYIYEGAGRDNQLRRHVGRRLTTLDDYRTRFGQYQSDPLLRAMHARCPWLVTWDDHEVENNYAGDISGRQNVDTATFLAQRAAAYQAYYEAMPLRRRSLPCGPHMRLYRTLSFGRLAEFQVLDTRQYRTDQPNGDRASDLNEAALNPKNTLLGPAQAGWLKASLLASPATWNVLAQQVMMGMVDIAAGEAKRYSMDQWCSAAHERMELVQFLADRRVLNPVVLTGDIHSNWVNDLRVDDGKADTPVVAAEFVGTSISSGGNGAREFRGLSALLSENPCVKFHNRQRGYVRCTVTPKTWRSDYQIVEEVTKPGGPVVTRASFVVEAGRPGVKPA